MDTSQSLLANYIATCSTDGCQNMGLKKEVLATEFAPLVCCGGCGLRISDCVAIE